MSESKGRVKVVEKSRSTSTGRCTITKGEAGIRDDPKKYLTRRWFAVDCDELTPSQADNYLTDGRGSPNYEKTMYLIISLKSDQRPRFAGNDDELSEVMRAATVEAMRVLAEGVEASRLVWVARTHPDYPRPCVKVLISRDIGREQSKVLKAFPRKLRSHWLPQKQQGEKRVLVSGGCEDAFLRVFDAAVAERSHPPSLKEERR
jgi:hypothetical protein